jgi:putative ABC transport system permease protein
MLFRFLDLLLGPAHETLVGDLHVCYVDVKERGGRWRAALWLVWQVLATVPRLSLQTLIWGKTMFKSYLSVALRQMRRYWSFSLINVMGLALSMTVCLLILSLLHDQQTVDSFHTKGDRIARVTSQVWNATGTYVMATSSSAMGMELARQSPDVEGLLQMRRSGGQFIREDGLRSGFSGLYAQPAFFDFFDFQLRAGDAASALDDPFEVVLSSELAHLLFGEIDPTGQVLSWQDVGELTVTGVMAPAPGKTHIRTDALLSFSTMESLRAGGADIPLGDWTKNSQFYNYVLVKEGGSRRAIEEVANTLGRQYHRNTETKPAEYTVQALADINLGADLSNQIASVMSQNIAIVLSILAAVLILTAVFNYVSLTVARSIRRAREIGIRKVMGAHRRQIGTQLVVEAVMTSTIALLIAGPLLGWLLPQFNGLTAVSEESNIMQVGGVDAALVFQFVVFALILGLIAGLLPAWRMSSFAPAATLRGLLVGGRNRFGIRKTLVVGQLVVSMVAIAFTVLVYRQTAFMNQADLGFDQQELLHVELQGLDFATVRSEFLGVPGITEVAATSEVPAGGSGTWTDVQVTEEEAPVFIQQYAVDEDFLGQYRITLIAGRNLVAGTADELEAVLLTESAVSLLRLGEPAEAVGREIYYDIEALDRPVTIVGVVSDFYANGMEDGLAAVTLVLRPARYRYAAVRFDGQASAAVIGRLQEAWSRLAPGAALRYQFYQDQVRESFSAMRDGIRILGLFAFLIVAIATLGLLGMASYSAEVRIKEIGIRKVVGAGLSDLLSLLSKEYLVLVVIASVIAAPAVVVLSMQYLSLFAEHVSIGLFTVLAGVVPVVTLALLTVGSQTVRAAVTDPVEVLKAE